MKQLYDSETLSSTQEMCQRGKGAQGEIQRKREGKGREGKREMGTDRLTEKEQKSRARLMEQEKWFHL